MDETEIVHGLDGQDALCHVKLGYVFGKRVVFDQPRRELWARAHLSLTWSSNPRLAKTP
jgi:hypothetical protein